MNEYADLLIWLPLNLAHSLFPAMTVANYLQRDAHRDLDEEVHPFFGFGAHGHTHSHLHGHTGHSHPNTFVISMGGGLGGRRVVAGAPLPILLHSHGGAEGGGAATGSSHDGHQRRPVGIEA